MDKFEYKVLKKVNLTHNTFLIELNPTIPQITSPEVSYFYYIYNEDHSAQRPYTPVAKFTFAIKVYKDGILSTYLNKKNVNDSVWLSGPVLKQVYIPNLHKDILLVAGGTGITPMLQLLAVNDNTRFTLINCNLSKEEIFLNNELAKYKNLKIYDILEDRDGRINKEILEGIIKLDDEILYDYFYVCGPLGFMNAVCGCKMGKEQGKLGGFLKEIGITENKVYKF